MVGGASRLLARHQRQPVTAPRVEVHDELVGEAQAQCAEAHHVLSRRVETRRRAVSRYTTRYRSFTAFARKLLTDGEIRVIEIKPLTDPEPLAREISRIGVNVNQIAHWANANEHITPAQVEEITASFDRIERLLGDLFDDRREAGKAA